MYYFIEDEGSHLNQLHECPSWSPPIFFKIPALQSMSGKLLVAPADLTLVGGNGKPPTESSTEIVSSGLLGRCNKNSILYTDGCQGWRKASKTSYRWKRFSVRSVVHKKSEWTKKSKVKGKAKWAGTQVLDRSWMWLKKKSCRIA